MKYSVTVKNGSLGITGENLLEKYVEKLSKKLATFADEVSELSLVMKKHDRHHFYSGVFTLHLPGKALVANTGEHTLEEVLAAGFAKLHREVETYKGKLQ
jgi:ribosome-associated translation inhibitor RaiA